MSEPGGRPDWVGDGEEQRDSMSPLLALSFGWLVIVAAACIALLIWR